jgi:ATP-dependent 26S proteasome regulatory subunit
MDFEEPEMSESGFYQIQLRPTVIEGTSCSIYYSAEVLRHDRNTPNETNDIIGLRACKTALNNTILLPERAPQHYISGTGYLPTRINVLLYGSESSGKNTLVRAFCAEHGYNLIVASYAGFRAVQDIPLIMAKAEQSEPCVILY